MVEKILDKIIVIGEGGSSNVTLIEGNDCIIVVDSSLFPQRAEKIKKFAMELFGKPVGYVINTHYHPDHTFGNCAFEGCEMISSGETRRKLEMLDVDYIKKVWDEETFEKYHLTLPNVTFDEEETYTLCGVKVTLKKLGGHTPDSSIVHLKDLGVLITGDLVFNEFHPEITDDTSLDLWIENLAYMVELMPTHVIPGHGRPSGLKSLIKMQEYLKKLQLFIEGKLKDYEIVKDQNFTSRKFPQLFAHSIEVLYEHKVFSKG